MKLILFLLAFLFLTAPALADVFDAPCSRYRVPKRLVLAIAKTESGLDPWVVNIAGKTYRPGSRAGALAIIRQARARGLSHDIGLMQINNWWLKHLNISPEIALEPRNNAALGVWIWRVKSSATATTGPLSAHTTPPRPHVNACTLRSSPRNTCTLILIEPNNEGYLNESICRTG